jgi:hypothetical protein
MSIGRTRQGPQNGCLVDNAGMSHSFDREPQDPHLELDQCARAAIGAVIEVHRHLGPGFLEAVYEHALMVELKQTSSRRHR